MEECEWRVGEGGGGNTKTSTPEASLGRLRDGALVAPPNPPEPNNTPSSLPTHLAPMWTLYVSGPRSRTTPTTESCTAAAYCIHNHTMAAVGSRSALDPQHTHRTIKQTTQVHTKVRGKRVHAPCMHACMPCRQTHSTDTDTKMRGNTLFQSLPVAGCTPPKTDEGAWQTADHRLWR